MRNAQYETWKEGGQHHFRIRASNGKVVGPTEAFSGHIRDRIHALRKAMEEADNYPIVVVPAPKKRKR